MSGTDTVLFELGTEELPPDSLLAFWFDLCQTALKGLASASLVDSQLQPDDLPDLYATRRLALEIPDVCPETASWVETRRGPALKSAFDEQGQPTKALFGFMRGCQAGDEQIERWRAGEDCLETEKGAWVTFEQLKPSRPVQEVLPEIMRQAVADVLLDARMRWGTGEEEFARPVRWVVLLYGGDIVPGNLMGLPFGRESRGHRVLGSGAIGIRDAKSYREQLEENFVLVKAQDRRQSMRRQWKQIVEQLQNELDEKVDTALPLVTTDRALSSVEYPRTVLGRFEKVFLDLPAEVVVAVLENQQGFFSMRDKRANLLPYFVAIANLPDRSGRIRIGCERVVQARLQDAAFYLKKDRQRKLADRIPDMMRVVFHQKLGTLTDRTRRIEKLAVWIAEKIDADCKAVRRAAQLCKADLGTDMVQSFPELQGVMGEYYARLDGEEERVCRAIKEHYFPPQGGMPMPSDEIGLALALADRLDMLFGVFVVNEVPTGTRDPLGVRRAARGILGLIWERSDIDMRELIVRATEGYSKFENAKEVIPVVMEYITDRLRSMAISNLHEKDEVEAVLAVGWHNPPEMFARLNALHSFRQNIAGVATKLVESNKRIRNILRKTDAPDGDVDLKLLGPAEKKLVEQVAALRPEVQELCREREFQKYYDALDRLSSLAEPVAAFFDDVLVMAEEPEIRHNRLRLLRDVRELFLTIADLSRLQGPAKES